MTDGGTGIIEVGGIVAAVVIHVVDVIFGFDVWVEVANLGEGLFPSVVLLNDIIRGARKDYFFAQSYF